MSAGPVADAISAQPPVGLTGAGQFLQGDPNANSAFLPGLIEQQAGLVPPPPVTGAGQFLGGPLTPADYQVRQLTPDPGPTPQGPRNQNRQLMRGMGLLGSIR